MQFNTYSYILVFLPLTCIGYFLINRFNYTAAKIFLVTASVFFYAYSGFINFVWLLISMVFNYLFVIALKKKKKSILWIGIVFNTFLLFYLKYIDFSITTVNALLNRNIMLLNPLLPLGISFFTFQQIAYLADTYKGETSENSILDYVLYITFFPKILMGPITKQSELIPQFHDDKKRQLSVGNLVKGFQMFTIGFFKKVVLADTFSKAVAWGFGDIGMISSMDTLLVMIAYAFQIYFDFSGYSDMAIASAMMLNIQLPINFDSPYQAYSIRDFWKRWHISLTGFLTKYIYIPLGGSRKGWIRTCFNTMIVFLISGIWHGANWTFILWGILHGLLSIFDRLTERFRKNVHPTLQWMCTFMIVSILWMLFCANSVSEWIESMIHMFSFYDTSISDGLISAFVLPETGLLIQLLHLEILDLNIRGLWMILFYVLALTICLGFENTYKKEYKNHPLSAVAYGILFVFTLICIGNESVFVYFNF